MKDEIKEINIPENVLVALGDLTNGALNYYKATETVKVKHNIILDYITNLQNENMKYDQCLTELTDNYKDMQKELTNLQEENERLKKELLSKPDNEITLETADGQRMTIIQSERINMQEKLNKSLEKLYKKYNDYKTRNEEAIEYINENKHLSMFADCREPEEDWNYDLEINPRELINILQGKSDE